jgi:hypothetical protein
VKALASTILRLSPFTRGPGEDNRGRVHPRIFPIVFRTAGKMMKSPSPSRAARAVLSLCLSSSLILLALGCGTNKGTVHGKVTYKGNLVTGGVIEFHDAKGKSAGAATISPEGEYSASNISPGNLKVTVDTSSVKNAWDNYKKMKAMMNTPGKDKSKMPKLEEPKVGAYVQIPKIYTKAEKTPLKFEARGGNQEENFELTGNLP